jgi:hypothetical protein
VEAHIAELAAPTVPAVDEKHNVQMGFPLHCVFITFCRCCCAALIRL